MFRAAAIYYVLSVYVSPPTDSFTDVAVYPPMTIKEEEDRVQSRLAALESNLDTPTDEKDPSDFVWGFFFLLVADILGHCTIYTGSMYNNKLKFWLLVQDAENYANLSTRKLLGINAGLKYSMHDRSTDRC
jgi:hypothetical protein